MAKRIDLVGKRFGDLIALNETINRNGHIFQKVRCDCGNELFVNKSHLTRGLTKSCGCIRNKLARQRLEKDYTGMKFNRVTLIERISPTRQNFHTLYKCKCDCGKEFIARGSAIVSGNTKSCGCYAHIAKSKPKLSLRKINKYEICDNVCYILFEGSSQKAIIDKEDIDKVKPFYWRIVNDGYVVSRTRGKNRESIRLHRLIVGNITHFPTDHINRNKLDNRKCNLRICTPMENANNQGISTTNTTGHKNIIKRTKDNKYVVNFIHMGITYWCGAYNTIEEALTARNKKYKEVGRPIED